VLDITVVQRPIVSNSDRFVENRIGENWRSAMETKLVRNPSRELTDLELEDVSAGRDYNLGFGIHLFVMGNYYLVYTDAKGPVIST
jgi:hypothetical protein